MVRGRESIANGHFIQMLMMQELTTDLSDRLVAHEKDFLALYVRNIVSIKKAKIKS
jgi:hypothetical protein